jgi:uncharacterized membrane protein
VEPTDAQRAAAATEVRTRRVVYSAALIYAVLFAAAATVVYLAFQGQRFDLGDMTQAVWSTAHGHFLRVTDENGRELVRLGGHVDPFLALFVPLWWAWPSPLMLLIVQAGAVASGALPVYWLARKHLKSERAAAHFAFAYLLFPATQFNAFTVGTGPHPVSFAIPILLFAIWFLDEERIVPFAILALLAASTKEEVPAAIGCLGIWYAFRKGHRIAGASIFVLGIAATLANLLIVIPHYAPPGFHPFAERYAQVGGTPTGILHKAVTHPLAFIDAVASWQKLLFVVLLFVPFVGLWLLEPLLVLGAVPDLAIDLLSSKPEQTTIHHQYTAGIIPFIVAASVLGAARVKKDPGRISFYALAGATCIALYSPIYFAALELPNALPSNPVRVAKVDALNRMPPGVAVSASNHLGGYLSTRRFISLYPHIGRARWVIVDTNDPIAGGKARYVGAVARLQASPTWKLVYASHGVKVLRRLP